MTQLSKRAQALLRRVKTPHNYYRTYGAKIPKAMQELIDAGLVKEAARYPLMISCFVPIGFQEATDEKFPE